MSIKRKTGARGLRTILEKVLLDTMYDIPSMDNVAKVIVDAKVVRNEAEPFFIYKNQQKQAATL